MKPLAQRDVDHVSANKACCKSKRQKKSAALRQSARSIETVAADRSVGRAQVAGFPGKVALAEGDLYLVVKGVLGADMSALGIGIGTDWSGGARKRPERALARSGREWGRVRS